MPRWDFRSNAKYRTTDGTERILCEHFLFPLSTSLSIAEVKRIINIANKWATMYEN